MMHPDDAQFECDVEMSKQLLGSITLPGVIPALYALIEMAVRIAPDEQMVRAVLDETLTRWTKD